MSGQVLMRIIHYMLGLRLWEGGVVRALIDVCNALARRGHDVTMLTNDASDKPLTWDGSPGRPRCEVLNRNRLKLLTAKSAARARELFREADVIHLHMPWDPICWQMGRIARWLDKPYFITTHGTLDDWSMAQRAGKKKIYLRLFARSLLEHATAVQCTARAEQDQASKWFPKGTPVVIPYLFDLEAYRALPGPQAARDRFPEAFNGPPTILFVSRLHEKKNPEALIEAAGMLRDRGEQFRVLLAGSGEAEYEQRLHELVRGAGLEAFVKFLGFVTGDLKTSLYQAADLFALPTKQENFGFVIAEALVCGTPVITTRGTDIWPELEQAGAAAIVDDGAKPLAEAIQTLLRDKSRRVELAARGRAWVHQHMDPSRVIRLYEELYEHAIAAQPE